jgi:hypothetical protein
VASLAGSLLQGDGPAHEAATPNDVHIPAI